MTWIIAAISLPISIFHFWLHALLPWWQKFPLLYYAFCGGIWAGVFYLMREIDLRYIELLFSPTPITIGIGYALMLSGALMILWSIYSLTPKRFFMWAVLRPESMTKIKIKKGAFRFIPHPAYTGYITATFGALLYSGKLYMTIVFLILLTITPIMIWLEEDELKKRLS